MKGEIGTSMVPARLSRNAPPKYGRGTRSFRQARAEAKRIQEILDAAAELRKSR